MSIDEGLDKGAAWILHRRDGDDPEQREKALEHLVPIRDRILGNARIRHGETLLDVGAGDGLIAFGAVERAGPNGRVIASDISAELVARTREIAEELGVAEQMSFVQASAEDLAPIIDGTVDVVTTRSVLIYVEAKVRSSREYSAFFAQAGAPPSSSRSTTTSRTRPTTTGGSMPGRSATSSRRSGRTRGGWSPSTRTTP